MRTTFPASEDALFRLRLHRRTSTVSGSSTSRSTGFRARSSRRLLRDLLLERLPASSFRAAVSAASGATPSSCARRAPAPRSPRPAPAGQIDQRRTARTTAEQQRRRERLAETPVVLAPAVPACPLGMEARRAHTLDDPVELAQLLLFLSSKRSSSSTPAWNSCCLICSTSDCRRSSISFTRFWKASRGSARAEVSSPAPAVRSPQKSSAPPVSRAPRARHTHRAGRRCCLRSVDRASSSASNRVQIAHEASSLSRLCASCGGAPANLCCYGFHEATWRCVRGQ